MWARIGYSLGIPGVITFVGTVTLFPAMEAESFSDTSCSFRRGQFEEGDSIDVHGVRVVSGSGGVYSGELSAFQSENSHFLGVKYLGLFNPFCNGGGIEDIESIIVASCWSSPRENWSTRVMLSEMPALEARFWKSVIYFWNPLSIIPSGRLNNF